MDELFNDITDEADNVHVLDSDDLDSVLNESVLNSMNTFMADLNYEGIIEAYNDESNKFRNICLGIIENLHSTKTLVEHYQQLELTLIAFYKVESELIKRVSDNVGGKDKIESNTEAKACVHKISSTWNSVLTTTIISFNKTYGLIASKLLLKPALNKGDCTEETSNVVYTAWQDNDSLQKFISKESKIALENHINLSQAIDKLGEAFLGTDTIGNDISSVQVFNLKIYIAFLVFPLNPFCFA